MNAKAGPLFDLLDELDATMSRNDRERLAYFLANEPREKMKRKPLYRWRAGRAGRTGR